MSFFRWLTWNHLGEDRLAQFLAVDKAMIGKCNAIVFPDKLILVESAAMTTFL
jgi:hypothetical protein